MAYEIYGSSTSTSATWAPTYVATTPSISMSEAIQHLKEHLKDHLKITIEKEWNPDPDNLNYNQATYTITIWLDDEKITESSFEVN